MSNVRSIKKEYKKVRKTRKSLKSRKSRKSQKRHRSKRQKSKRRNARSFGVKIDGIELEKYTDNKDKDIIKKVQQNINNIRKNLNKIPSVTISIGMLFFMLFFSVYSSYNDYKNKTNTELFQTIFNYLIGGSILGQHLLKDYLYKTIDDIKPYLLANEAIVNSHEIIDEFENLKKQGLVTKEYEKFYNNCVSMIEEYSMYNYRTISKEEEKIIKNISDFIKFIIVIAKKTKRVKISIEVLKNLNDDLEEFLTSYGSSNKKLVSSVIEPILVYLAFDNEKIDPPPLNPIFLVGNPGVGKTRFVKNIITKLNANAEYYKTEKQLDRFETVRLGRDFSEQSNKFSAITNLILKSKKDPNKINILFIDEIDKILFEDGNDLNDLLLKMLNSTQKVFRDQFLEIQLEVPKNMLIICASNTSLEDLATKNSSFEPLKSRFIEIFIPDLSKEMQVDLSIKYMKTLDPDVDNSDIEFIRNYVYKSNYPGMRELELFINEYVTKKLSINVLKNIKNVEDISEYRKDKLNKL